MFTKDMLMKAGLATIAMMLASNLTAGQSTLIRGGAQFGAALVALAVIAPKL